MTVSPRFGGGSGLKHQVLLDVRHPLWVVSVLSKNTNELKTGAPGRFDRHRPVASPRSGACRRRCRRFGFPVRAPHLDQNVLAGYAAVALASILDPSGGLFSDAARPCQRPALPFGRKRGTRKSRLETNPKMRPVQPF